jgi:hypothetical protein
MAAPCITASPTSLTFPSPAPLSLPPQVHLNCAGAAASPPPLPETAAPPAPPPLMAATAGTRPHRLGRPFPSLLHPIKAAPSSPASPAPPPRRLLAHAQAEPERRRPPEIRPPDLLLRRVFLLSKPPGKVLVSSSFFWSSSREVSCTGGSVSPSPAILRRPRRPAPSRPVRPPPLAAASRCQPSICKGTAQMDPNPRSNFLITVNQSRRRPFCKNSPELF